MFRLAPCDEVSTLTESFRNKRVGGTERNLLWFVVLRSLKGHKCTVPRGLDPECGTKELRLSSREKRHPPERTSASYSKLPFTDPRYTRQKSLN